MTIKELEAKKNYDKGEGVSASPLFRKGYKN